MGTSDSEPGLGLSQRQGGDLGQSANPLGLDFDLHTSWVALPSSAVNFVVGILVSCSVFLQEVPSHSTSPVRTSFIFGVFDGDSARGS